MPYGWKIELNSVDISDKVSRVSVLKNIENYCKEMTLDISDASLYSGFDFDQVPDSPEIEIFTKTGETFVSQGTFFVERPEIASSINADLLQGIWGRSLTAILDEPFATKVTKVWETQTTFYAICDEMCDLAGFTWSSAYSDIDDFVIYPYTFEVDGLYPIEVISELVKLAKSPGGFVTTDKDDHLCIKLTEFSPSSEDVTITDSDTENITEQYERPTFANRLRITPTGALASYSVDLSIPNQCLHADNESKTKLIVQVRDADGEPVNGIIVDWTQNGDTADLTFAKTNTQTIMIQNERQTATDYYTLKTDIPASSIDGIWAYTDAAKATNLASGGYTIDNNTVTLTNKLQYCDQSLVVSYRAAGGAVNYLQAGYTAEDVTVTADVEGQRASEIVYIENPCQCPPSIRLTSAPSSIVLNEVSKLIVYVEESGPVTSGRLVFMEESGGDHGDLDWQYARLGTVNIKNEKTSSRNEIAGVTQCEISMYAASVTSVYQADEDGEPTGGNLYSSFDGKIINLNTSLDTGTDLLVTYVAQGAALNMFKGEVLGTAAIRAYIETTSEEPTEDSENIRITDAASDVDGYDDDDYGGVGGSSGFDFDPVAIICTKADGSRVECGSSQRCCSDGSTYDCRDTEDCIGGGDIDPCYPGSIEGEPTSSALQERFSVGLEYECTCEEMCQNEFDIYGTTPDYDGYSMRDISDIVVEDYSLELGSAEYWEKYAELKAEALAACENMCACASGMEWDTENSPETIVAGESAEVFVINGVGPFEWSVAGNGYSAVSEETVIGTNEIQCASGQCGTDFDAVVTVIVTDSCGNVASGVLRNTAGQWVLIDECDPGGWDGIGVLESIEGEYKYEDDWCGEPCETNCAGGPCEAHTVHPIPEEECWVESSRTYQWSCVE